MISKILSKRSRKKRVPESGNSRTKIRDRRNRSILILIFITNTVGVCMWISKDGNTSKRSNSIKKDSTCSDSKRETKVEIST